MVTPNKNKVSDKRIALVLELLSYRWISSTVFYAAAWRHGISNTSAGVAVRQLIKDGRVEARGMTRTREYRKVRTDES